MELIVVMVIMAILTAIAVPSYRYVTTDTRMAGEADALLGDLQYARAEAVREGQPVTVCIRRDNADCDSASTAWQAGWLVFSDANGNQSIDAPTDQVLRIQKPLTGGDTFQSNNSVHAITFSREGFARLGANGVIIALHDSTDNSTYTRCVEVTQSGMMSVDTTSQDANCT